jgi:hypothetical protein
VSERFDRYNLAARLEKFGDELMTLCEKHAAIENRIDVCNQISAVCRIVATLKALRMEDRLSADPDAAIAGSAVRKYTAEFAAPRRAVAAGVEAASDSFIDDSCGTDPAEE